MVSRFTWIPVNLPTTGRHFPLVRCTSSACVRAVLGSTRSISGRSIEQLLLGFRPNPSPEKSYTYLIIIENDLQLRKCLQGRTIDHDGVEWLRSDTHDPVAQTRRNTHDGAALASNRRLFSQTHLGFATHDVDNLMLMLVMVRLRFTTRLHPILFGTLIARSK